MLINLLDQLPLPGQPLPNAPPPFLRHVRVEAEPVAPAKSLANMKLAVAEIKQV
jgi:hypothetical protein